MSLDLHLILDDPTPDDDEPVVFCAVHRVPIDPEGECFVCEEEAWRD